MVAAAARWPSYMRTRFYLLGVATGEKGEEGQILVRPEDKKVEGDWG